MPSLSFIIFVNMCTMLGGNFNCFICIIFYCIMQLVRGQWVPLVIIYFTYLLTACTLIARIWRSTHLDRIWRPRQVAIGAWPGTNTAEALRCVVTTSVVLTVMRDAKVVSAWWGLEPLPSEATDKERHARTSEAKTVLRNQITQRPHHIWFTQLFIGSG